METVRVGLARYLIAVWRRFPVRGPGRLILRIALGGSEDIRATYGRLTMLTSLAHPPEVKVLCWGTYEADVEAVIAAWLLPGMSAIDVGANCGVLTMAMWSRVGNSGRVLAVEPSATACERIEEQRRLNEASSMTVAQVAAGSSDGEALFAPAACGHGLLPEGHEQLTVGELQRTPIARLDRIVDEAQLGKVDFVKIDTDGAECEALRGLSETLRRDQPVLVVELFGEGLQRNGASRTELLDLLDAWGYDVYVAEWAARSRLIVSPPGVIRFVSLPDGGRQLDESSSTNLLAISRSRAAHRELLDRLLGGSDVPDG